MEKTCSKSPITEVCECKHNGDNHDIDGCLWCSCKRVFY